MPLAIQVVDHVEQNAEPVDHGPRNPITRKVIMDLCVQHGFYRTPSCNDKLYLHHKGFDKIAGLEDYTEVKVIWLEGNCISAIEGLDSMKQPLRSLYLHENSLNSVDGVHIFENLDGLNISDNRITSLNGFSPPQSLGHKGPLATLTTLQAKNNLLRSIDDITILREFEKLSVLDLSGNKLDDGEALLGVLEKISTLKSLRLSGNPCVRNIAQYRRTVLSRCKHLMYLDDRPVFDDERRLVTAWTVGGSEGEKLERAKIKEEEDEKIRKRLEDFREMCRGAAAEQEEVTHGSESSESSDDETPRPDTSSPNKRALSSNDAPVGSSPPEEESTEQPYARHIDPNVDSSCGENDASLHIARGVSLEALEGAPTVPPTQAAVMAEKKRAKFDDLWEIAKQVSNAQERAASGEEGEQLVAADVEPPAACAEEEEEDTMWTPS
jgi:dynein assembly factor 1